MQLVKQVASYYLGRGDDEYFTLLESTLLDHLREIDKVPAGRDVAGHPWEEVHRTSGIENCWGDRRRFFFLVAECGSYRYVASAARDLGTSEGEFDNDFSPRVTSRPIEEGMDVRDDIQLNAYRYDVF